MARDSRKTKKDLLSEAESLRARVAELEKKISTPFRGEAAEEEYDRLQKALNARTGQLLLAEQELRRFRSLIRDATQPSQSTQEILDRIFSTTQISIAYLDSEFNFIRVNKGYAEQAGHSIDFFPGKNHFDLFPNEKDLEHYRRVVQTGESFFCLAAPFIHSARPEQDITYWDWALLPIFGSAGKVESLLLLAVDVTEQVHTEKALRKSEERYRLHFENVGDVVYVTDTDFRIVDVSPSVKGLLGYTPEEIIGRRITDLDLIVPEYLETALRNTQRVLAGEKSGPTEYEFITKDGTRRFGEISGAPLIRDGVAFAVVSVARDITNRKRIEMELEQYRQGLEELVERRTEELLRVNDQLRREIIERQRLEETLRNQAEFSEGLINSSADGIVAFDCEFRFTVWNPVMERVIGIPKAQVLGKNAFELFPFLTETGEDRNYAVVLEGRTVTSTDRPYYVQQTGRQGFYEAHYSPQRDARGAIVGGLMILRDISARKRSEEILRESEAKYRSLSEGLEVMVRKQVAELRQAETLAAIGKMISIVAHEIRNPLQNVRLGFETLRIISTDNEQVEILNDIEGGLDMLMATVEELLDYSRPARLHLAPRKIEEVIQYALNLLQPQMRNISIQLEVESGEKEILIDGEKLSRALMNLLINAAEAMSDGGKIAIRSRFLQQDAGTAVRICVSDTGCGIPEDILLQVAEPFFTTKPRGTGLGLSICKKIVEAHGGEMLITSRHGEGTQVEIMLPIPSDYQV